MTCPHTYNQRCDDAAIQPGDPERCSICLRAEVAELRLQLEASREHTAEVIASGEALAAERDSAHAAVVEEQRLCALKLRGLTLERDFQAAQARDLGRQFREASEKLAAAESRAEKLERALEMVAGECESMARLPVDAITKSERVCWMMLGDIARSALSASAGGEGK